MSYRFTSPAEAAELLKSDTKTAIIDVRDSDYIGGHITGCIHSPSGSFESDVDKLVKKLKDVPVVIVHCALSQQRGPSCARRYAAAREATDSKSDQDILVLRGGFTAFQAQYKDDPALVEGWSKEIWQSTY
ncbi:uncharacterized protein L969DRAFT_95516 [Mixia osmundae IAM 14324]|uniref:Rhodanese domain-containing protein n=1 Tax=Mixia osmundae (strain CBS 9802 / IAM 14324 / JCM 22182 / KY 12970) TaxID=764103 RepID=G7E7M8_MIXOS|nr:uncharacterized protein L969DRAFT_95516 [Mixia osmundae IAM 14324]KEI38438.1 hypothetical protein L969DRAFT_95516 [Mixia osmundae IAM 14324]GAA98838.1 hypothetical protein E5Q_05526 [Mixia osmundae IAM 14324]